MKYLWKSVQDKPYNPGNNHGEGDADGDDFTLVDWSWIFLFKFRKRKVKGSLAKRGDKQKQDLALFCACSEKWCPVDSKDKTCAISFMVEIV